MYKNARGVVQDPVEAHFWYSLAEARLEPGEERDIAIRNRDLMARKLTRKQLATSHKRIEAWQPKE